MNFYKRHLGDYAKDAGHLSMLEHGAYTLLLDRYYTTEKPLATLSEAYRVCRARSAVERAAVDAVLAEFFVTDGDSFLNRRAEEEIAKAAHQRTVNQEIGKRGGNPYLKEQYNEPGELYVARLPDGRIKVGVTAAGWSKRAYGLAKTYGGKPEALAVVRVSDMGAMEAALLAEFSEFASGEVLTLPDELVPKLVASAQAKGVANHQPNRLSITSPSQTPDSRLHKTPPPPEGEFARFWQAYPATPRKVARKQCLAKWQSQGCEPISGTVLAGLEAFKASDDWRKDSGAFIPAPLVWLNQRRWEAIEELPPEQPTSGVVEAKEFLARFDRAKAEMTLPPADLMRRIRRAA